MVFAVAHAADGKQHEPMADGTADGSRYPEIPVSYTCWLYDSSKIDGKPEKLFEAACSHTGYIGAGLAVCWHPDGSSLGYIDQSAPKQHRLWTFNLTTRKADVVQLPPAEHIAISSSPGQLHRLALLGGDSEQKGLWIEEAATGEWWRVDDSTPQTEHLEELRQRLPTWSRDGTKLAFADGPNLRICDIATRRTERWLLSQQKTSTVGLSPQPALADVYWHPDGKRIGVVENSRLVLVGPADSVRQVSDSTVVSFAGWDKSGRWMAYITTEIPPYTFARWATLFVPNFNARTAVWLTDANGEKPGEKVISGVRATFPHWSPNDRHLSVWLTVEPPYRLADDDRLGMPPGDPAAIIDPETGKLEWLPVSGTEHAQIGHIELRTGHLDAALRRFEEATASLPKDGKADWMFFRAIALEKSGREDEVRDALRRFEPPSPTDRARTLAYTKPYVELSRAFAPVPGPMADPEVIRSRHRFAAEAFVSLDMAAEGIDFFRNEVKKTKDDLDRLSAVVALCQLLLVTDRRVEYTELVIDQLLPLAGRVLPKAGPNREGTDGVVALTLLPLAVSEFAAPLHEELIRRVCKKMSAGSPGDVNLDFACQLVLRSLGRSLRDEAVIKKANIGLADHPARAKWKLYQDDIDLELLTQIRLSFLLPGLLLAAFDG
jgi:Tol biopolymer transport system component